MNEGKRFERSWRESVPRGSVYYFRVKDPPPSFPQGAPAVRFTPKNPFDLFLFWDRCLFPMELKTTAGKSFSMQRGQQDKGKQIQLGQMEGLAGASLHGGVYACFILDFRGSQNTYAWGIHDFQAFFAGGGKKSANEGDVAAYGGILVPKRLKRAHYAYDILGLLKMIRERGVGRGDDGHDQAAR